MEVAILVLLILNLIIGLIMIVVGLLLGSVMVQCFEILRHMQSDDKSQKKPVADRQWYTYLT